MEMETALPGCGPVLEEIDSLPGAQCKSTVDQGYGKARLRQRRADVGGHVVGTFLRMMIM